MVKVLISLIGIFTIWANWIYHILHNIVLLLEISMIINTKERMMKGNQIDGHSLLLESKSGFFLY